MATTSRPDISTKFENGDIPSQEHFGQIIESFVHKDDKADFQMVEIGTDNEHYVTPALLRTGLQNIGIVTGNSYMPIKENFDDFQDDFLTLQEVPVKNSVQVFKNGQLLLEGPEEGEEYDYTINYDAGIITFSAALDGRNIEVDYWFKNLSPSPGNGSGGEGSEPVDLTNFLHTTGNETKNGILTFNNTTAASTSGIALNNSGSGSASASLNVSVSGAGKGISVQNSSTGTGVYLNSTAEATGDILQVAKNNVVKAKIEDDGVVTAYKFVSEGGTEFKFVKGDGSLDPTVYAEDSKVLHTTGEESRDGALTLTNSLPQDVLTISKNDSANCLKLVQNSVDADTTATLDTSTDTDGRKAISIEKLGDPTAFITHDGDIVARSFSTTKADLTDDGLFSLESRTSPESSEGTAKLYAKSDGTDTHMYVMGSDGAEKKIGGDVDLSEYAKLDSPNLTGVPTAPTATAGTNTTQIATTAFINNAISTFNSGLVTIAGNQTITGQKTFTDYSTFSSIGLSNSYISSQGNGLDSNTTYGNGAIGFKNGHFSFASVGKPSAIIATSNVTLITNPILQVPNSSGTIALTTNPTSITATSFIKSGGTSSQYLMADGSVTSYVTPVAEPSQITITTTSSITTDTLDANSKKQIGKNVVISNGSSAINITVNGGTDFCASYLKVGTGAITFVQGSGRTLVLVDGTAVLNGIAGSTATISSVGTTDYLRISNA